MFATFNLHFSPIDIMDDTLPTPAMTPEVAPIAEFADLLRLRVDPAGEPGTDSGQVLPKGGSDLPLQPLPVEFEAPETPVLIPLPQALEPGTDLLPESVLTPSLQALAAEQPVPASLIVEAEVPVPLPVTPGVIATNPAIPVGDSSDALLTTEARPLPAVQLSPSPAPVTPAQIQETVTSLSSKLDANTPVLREPAIPIPAQPVAVASADKAVPIVELPRRTEALLLPAINVEEISDVFKARPTVTQPVQVLNTQPNPQQPIAMSAPLSTAAADTGFTTAMQQASDLISIPVRDTAWAERIGERVLMMTGKQLTTAEIRLTPAELGPLRVQVAVEDGAANVTFQAQHAVTREALEQALPRLRELLAENGLSLGQASVGEHGVAEDKRDERSNTSQGASGEAFDGDDASEANEPKRVVASDSLVDTFV